jgi:hypothetical protein
MDHDLKSANTVAGYFAVERSSDQRHQSVCPSGRDRVICGAGHRILVRAFRGTLYLGLE